MDEKKITQVADIGNGLKEVSKLVINRHYLGPEDKVLLVEDVCNNFSTTRKAKELVESKGAKLIGIACAVNRSSKKVWEGIPVVSAIFCTTVQFKQDDPEVAILIAPKKIIWDPKQQWEELLQEMK